ncbi:MAG: VOC family protein [Candidatus Eremiobacteraeota bacterium]|nr:VOC family protein [Candidatus Eremiobacteraeota bacterium]
MERLLPIRDWTPVVDDPGLNVSVCFGADSSGVRYEIVAPFGSPNPVSRVLNDGRQILNHVAYRVHDLESAIDRVRATGAIPMGEPKPALAFGGARVIFFLTALGFILELIEDAPAT